VTSPIAPAPQGLYDPAREFDACGVGFVVQVKGKKSHDIITQGLRILVNLQHRGAVGADPLASDGAGILIQIPDALLRPEAAKLGIALPPPGQYAVGMTFLPQNPMDRRNCEAMVEDFVAAEGQKVLGWRDVPVNRAGLGKSVLACEPMIRQVFIARGGNAPDQDAFERKLYVIRKQCANHNRDHKVEPGRDFYPPSMSSRTIVYKRLARRLGYFSKLCRMKARYGSTSVARTAGAAVGTPACASTRRTVP